MDLDEFLASNAAVIDPSLMEYADTERFDDATSPEGHSEASHSSPVQSRDLATIAKFQVCTSCRKKKRRCNLERPTCSLCKRNGWSCEYRHLKKRPGPPKSSGDDQRYKRNSSPTGLPAQSLVPVGSQDRQLSTSEGPAISSSEVVPFLASRTPAIQSSPATGQALHLSQETKANLISLYFDHVQPTFPMFRRQVFDEDVRDNRIPETLLYSIFALGSRFVPESERLQTFGQDFPEPWEYLARLSFRKSRFNEENDIHTPMSLNDVKTSFILTLYEYTSFPGPKAWMRVGTTVRAAMAAGLHQLDLPDNWRFLSMSEAEKEEWRYTWWAVWRVDSSINVLASSPFGINTCNIHTALPSTSVADFTNGIIESSSGEFLQADPITAWKSLKDLHLAMSKDSLSIYFQTVSYNREATTSRQRLRVNPTPDLIKTFNNLKNIFPYLQMVLPQSFFNGIRRTSGESLDQHRQRLETLVLLHITEVVLYLPFRSQNIDETNPRQKKKLLADWQHCVDNVEDIAALFRHWGLHYSQLSDPMISCSVWICCSILTLHTMSSSYQQSQSSDPENTIPNSLELLSAALEGFSRYWQIAGLLLKSLESLRSWDWLCLDFSDLLSVAAQFQAPIDPQSQDPGTINVWPAIMNSKQVMLDVPGFLE